MTIFDKPPKRPLIKPCTNLKSIAELNEDFSLETKVIHNQEEDDMPVNRGYSRSVP
jgi:hypothetical protein